jgi:hypothetical protein
MGLDNSAISFLAPFFSSGLPIRVSMLKNKGQNSRE